MTWTKVTLVQDKKEVDGSLHPTLILGFWWLKCLREKYRSGKNGRELEGSDSGSPLIDSNVGQELVWTQMLFGLKCLTQVQLG